VHAIFILCFAFNSIVPAQGTKVLEDREIRLSVGRCAKGAPPRQASSGITKYTGILVTPEWRDAEPGRVFNPPLVPCERRSEPKRKLSNVVSCQCRHLQRSVYVTPREDRRNELQTDVRYNPARGPHGTQGTGRLDRLQNRTSDPDLISTSTRLLFIYCICMIIGDREKVCSDVLRGSIFLRLSPIFRSDAVVVYDDPSEGA